MDSVESEMGTANKTWKLGNWPLLRPLAGRDFRLLWLGESISVLGDQVFFVALAWLTLTLTGSGLALGTVLMVFAIPRLGFMLVGGAFSDRLSPRTLMLVSNVARAILDAILTMLVLSQTVQMWHLYILAAAFGLVDAFFYPAFNTIVPALLPQDKLEAGNALIRGTAQLAGLIGPAPAGAVIAALGTGLAFGFDTATFLFAALMLWLMSSLSARAGESSQASAPHQEESVRDAIVAGLRYAWNDPVIRSMLLIVAAVDFSFVGPFNVGVSSLAAHHFSGGAASLGMMFSAWGGGALLGAVVAGSVRVPRNRGLVTLGIVSLMGVGLALLGIVPDALSASAIIGAKGIGSGMVNVMAMSWLQTRVPQGLLGRIMSLVMLASVGLSPISYALAGALVDLHAALLFGAAGAIVLVAAAGSALNPAMRSDML